MVHFEITGQRVSGDIVRNGILIPFDNLARWTDAQLAQYGIVRVTDPDPVQIPATITRRQFFQQLAIDGTITEAEALAAIGGGVIPTILAAIINALPADQQFGAKCLLAGAYTFERLHPLSEAVRVATSKTTAQRDVFFIAAAALA